MDEHCSWNTFATLLAGRRTEAGLSQEALAALAGVSVRALRDLEAGRVAVPQRRSVEALASALSLTGEARDHFLRTVSNARRDRNRNRSGRTGRAAPESPAPIPVPGGGRDRMRPVSRPAQVPPLIWPFAGRTAELLRLRALLEPGSSAVVTGSAGMGKTALAVRAAHLIGGRFPDGELYVDLAARPDLDARGTRGQGEGRDASCRPLARLLRGLGFPHERIPAGRDERAEAFRGITARRRLLIVLDNVPSSEAVRPLLPCAPRCAVLLTTRRSCSRLPGCHEVPLGPLRLAESAELFGRIAGPRRVAAEPEATAAVLELCGGSPLAVRASALWLARRPGWSVDAAVRRLSSERQCEPVD